MNVLTRLRMGEGFSDGERALADAILADPEAFLDNGSKQLAARAHVSKSTVYRLCEKLDCPGLADLRVRVASALADFRRESAGVDVNFPVRAGQNGAQVIEAIEKDLAQTLASTANVLDPAALDRAAELVRGAEHVTVLATAGNVAFAQNFRFQMAEVGRTVSVPVDEYEQRLAAASAGEKDAVVLVSFGGRGFVSRPAARELAGRGVPIVLVASADSTPLDEFATVKLALSPAEDHARKVSPFGTGLSLLFVLDALFARCFVDDFDANLARRLGYYDRIVGMGGCSGGPAS